MPLTLVEQTVRANRIGASDVAVLVMGNHYPWKKNHNQKSLWLDKMGHIKDWDGNAATNAGDLMEPTFRKYMELYVGPVTTAADTARSDVPRQVLHPNEVMLATLDARCVNERRLAEFKSVGQCNPFWDRDRWGKPGDEVRSSQDCSHPIDWDQDDLPEFGEGVIPAEYYWQVQAQLSCANAYIKQAAARRGIAATSDMLFNASYLVVNLPGTAHPFRHFLVHRNDQEIAHLESAVCDWWDRWIVTDQEPDAILTPYTMGRMILADVIAPVIVDNHHFETIFSLKEQIKPLRAQAAALEKQLKLAEAQMIDESGPVRRIYCEAGHSVHISRVSVKASDAYEYDRRNYCAAAPTFPAPQA